jgi:hypothetical protein
MKKNGFKYFKTAGIKNWSETHFFELILLSGFLFSLFLLRSAGYFHPYFSISINFIIFAALVLTVPIFKTTSKIFFWATLAFWLFAGFLRIVRVDVWAERTGIYAYEALFIGLILFFFELIFRKNSK